MKNNYFTTGEFAKLCGVNKQTLFYYDKEGIFSPDIVAENGYRYYAHSQLETFTVILMLRDLGVHLKEIKDHMDSRSPEALVALLESKKLEIDRKVKALEWSKRYINNKIRITEEGLNAPIGLIQTQELPERYMVASDYRGSNDDMTIAKILAEHMENCDRLGLHNACPIGALIPLSSVNKSGYDYSKFYTIVEKTESPGDSVLIPGGKHLVLYDNHGYQNIHKNCLKIIEYANSHNLDLENNLYEDVILDDLSTGGYFNYQVKLSIKIK